MPPCVSAFLSQPSRSDVLSFTVFRAAPRHARRLHREIGLWWWPNDVFRFTPRSPGRLALEPRLAAPSPRPLENGEAFEIGRVIVWEPGARLGLTWRQASFRPNQHTLVEVRFELVGEETRVTVEHSGWDTVPQDDVSRHGFPDGVFLRRHGEWWQALLSSYRLAVDVSALAQR